MIALGGCVTRQENPEAVREVVLKYLNTNVGTVGPFSHRIPKDLVFLTPEDEAASLALLNRGAIAFLVAEAGSATATRVILVQKVTVIADYHAIQKSVPAAER